MKSKTSFNMSGYFDIIVTDTIHWNILFLLVVPGMWSGHRCKYLMNPDCFQLEKGWKELLVSNISSWRGGGKLSYILR